MSQTQFSKKVLILSGGKGSRIGGKKYQVHLNNIPLIVHIYKKLVQLGLPIYISVRKKEQALEIIKILEDFGIKILQEMFIEDEKIIINQRILEGPLIGIYSALKKHPLAQFLTIAIDQPFLEKTLLETLLKTSNQYPNKVIIYKNEEKMEPFPGIYPANILHPLYNFLIKSPKKSFFRFFLLLRESGSIIFLQPGKITYEFLNINTKKDLEIAQRLVSKNNYKKI